MSYAAGFVFGVGMYIFLCLAPYLTGYWYMKGKLAAQEDFRRSNAK